MNNLFQNQFELGCISSILICVLLASMYVGSLYIWGTSEGRDHPSTVKKRSLSVFLMSFVSAIFVYVFSDREYFGYDVSFSTLLGFRLAGLLPSIIFPLVLTMILFLGPISLQYSDGRFKNLFDWKMWHYCITNMLWLRNHVVLPMMVSWTSWSFIVIHHLVFILIHTLCLFVGYSWFGHEVSRYILVPGMAVQVFKAPFSEEFTFRACMLPILVPCFGNKTSVILCPFFFGIAHLHHLSEKLANGARFKAAVLQSLFQFTYTTIFGAYSTYLFLQTGHVSAPFIAHAFCNFMGFPDFGQLFELEQPKRTILMICFVVGLALWIILLKPMTDPYIYSNDVYLPTYLE